MEKHRYTVCVKTEGNPFKPHPLGEVSEEAALAQYENARISVTLAGYGFIKLLEDGEMIRFERIGHPRTIVHQDGSITSGTF